MLYQLLPLPQLKASSKAGIVPGSTLLSMGSSVLASLRDGQNVEGAQHYLVSDGVCL